MSRTESHEELFGSLADDNFTAQEAAEYLEVSVSTFRRFVASGLTLTLLYVRYRFKMMSDCYW